MTKEITKNGTIFYYGDNGFIHREGGPAVEYTNGDKYWCKNGKFHREDGPAVERIYEDGSYYKEYWYDDKHYPNIKTDRYWKRFVKLLIFQ